MQTNVRDTSLDAYEALVSCGTLGHQSQVIMQFITLRSSAGLDLSLRELCLLTGFEINAVSGRCWELKAKRMIEEAPKRKCSISRRTVHPLRLPTNHEGEQSELFN
jgi:hypothetical protein